MSNVKNHILGLACWWPAMRASTMRVDNGILSLINEYIYTLYRRTRPSDCNVQ